LTKDYIRSKQDEIAIEQGCYFDEAPALKVKSFIEKFCVQSKHPWTGKPLQLLEWQWEQIVKPLYGWFRKDGTRRYKEAGIWIPKKQGKSTLISALSLWHLLEYPGSSCYCLASNVRQAGIVYSETASMCELGPLSKYCGKNKTIWIRRNLNTIEYKDKKGNRSTLQILPCSPEGCSGWNANFICYDELAEWNGTHAQTIWDRLKNATAARTNALKVVISTPQYDRESCGYHRYSYAKSVLTDEIIDTTFLAVIFEVPQEEDWTDIEVLRKANPSMGVTVPEQDYIDDLQTTLNNPREEMRFRCLRAVIRLGFVSRRFPDYVPQTTSSISISLPERN